LDVKSGIELGRSELETQVPSAPGGFQVIFVFSGGKLRGPTHHPPTFLKLNPILKKSNI
jgi:hypothetical protein